MMAPERRAEVEAKVAQVAKWRRGDTDCAAMAVMLLDLLRDRDELAALVTRLAKDAITCPICRARMALGAEHGASCELGQFLAKAEKVAP